MSKKFNFVFITTNLLNGKQYVGDHSTNDLNCYKTKNYLGSGRPHFERAKKKYGKENFKREILEIFETKKEAFDAQEKYIKQFNTLTPNGYNISPKGGHNVKDCWGDESKKKLSKNKKGSLGYFKDKKLSKEHKQKISVSLKGKTKSFSKEDKIIHIENIKLAMNRPEVKEKLIGRKHSKETKEKLRNINLGHTRQTGEKNSQYNKKWIVNSSKTKKLCVHHSEVDNYLKDGWTLGRKFL